MTNSEVPEKIRGENLPKQRLDGRVLGVLTGQVLVDSMPIATQAPTPETDDDDERTTNT